MEKTKKKISDKESEISNKEDELILAKAKENDQYESMKKRIRLLTGILIICCSCVAAGKENTGESGGDGFYLQLRMHGLSQEIPCVIISHLLSLELFYL